MAVRKVCDICKQDTKKIVGKLQFIPTDRAKARTHSNYTHHADVGECCSERVLKGFNFRQRMTRKEYLESRKG
jgi:hypothetical protein